MLKAFLAGVRKSGTAADASEPAERRVSFGTEQIKLLIEFFPIGKKLRYIPEFNKEIVFDTLLVAYCVNGEYIYSWESIELDASGVPTAFLVGDRGVRIPVSQLKQFQILVPDTSDLELTLDYHRRAIIGRGRQFIKGNYISLISNSGARGVSTMDTEVAKQVFLKDGPYAYTKLVLLTPELETLVVTDQRNKNRTKTCVPVTMSVGENRLRGPCTIVDVSDLAVRIRVRDGEVMPPMKAGDAVALDFDLGEGGRSYAIKGSVIRRSSEACVIRLDALSRDGHFAGFGPLDMIELKSGLLNYGK